MTSWMVVLPWAMPGRSWQDSPMPSEPSVHGITMAGTMKGVSTAQLSDLGWLHQDLASEIARLLDNKLS